MFSCVSLVSFGIWCVGCALMGQSTLRNNKITTACVLNANNHGFRYAESYGYVNQWVSIAKGTGQPEWKTNKQKTNKKNLKTMLLRLLQWLF